MAVDKKKIQAFIGNHQGDRNALVAILQDIQGEYNYLPEDALRQVAGELKVPLIDVIGVATFYRAFSLTPRGKHTCTVCLGTACHVRGGPKILDEFERQLHINPGQTTPDGQFSLETVACLGCCAIGPVVVVDKEYHSHTSVRQVGPILKKRRK